MKKNQKQSSNASLFGQKQLRIAFIEVKDLKSQSRQIYVKIITTAYHVKTKMTKSGKWDGSEVHQIAISDPAKEEVQLVLKQKTLVSAESIGAAVLKDLGDYIIEKELDLWLKLEKSGQIIGELHVKLTATDFGKDEILVPLFGVTLEELAMRQTPDLSNGTSNNSSNNSQDPQNPDQEDQGPQLNNQIPSFVGRILDFLKSEKGGWKEEGTLRLAGNSKQFNTLRRRIERGEDVDLVASTEYIDPNCVVDLLKKFLRELPEPLIPDYIATQLNQTIEENNREVDGLYEKLDPIWCQVPCINFNIFKDLIEFLHIVYKHSDQNKMGIGNITMVLAPTLRFTGFGLTILIPHPELLPPFVP